MENVPLSVLTGILLVIGGLMLILPFEALRRLFDYPDILRLPTGEVLQKYHDGGTRLQAVWLVFASAAALFLVVVMLLDQAIGSQGTAIPYLGLATVIGVLAALFNMLGLVRWVFLVPILANRYLYPGTSRGTREAIEVTFEAFHTYLGVTVGEFLGFTAMAAWGILIALALTAVELIPAWFGFAGVVVSVGVFIGVFEFAGWKLAGAIVAVSSLVWALWLIGLGFFFLFS